MIVEPNPTLLPCMCKDECDIATTIYTCKYEMCWNGLKRYAILSDLYFDAFHRVFEVCVLTDAGFENYSSKDKRIINTVNKLINDGRKDEAIKHIVNFVTHFQFDVDYFDELIKYTNMN